MKIFIMKPYQNFPGQPKIRVLIFSYLKESNHGVGTSNIEIQINFNYGF